MANTLREESVLSLAPEGTWGTAIDTSGTDRFVEVPVEPGEWLRDVVDRYQDRMVRNILARDFLDVPTVARAEGSLRGMFYPLTTGYFLRSIFGAETTADLRNAAGTNISELDVHEFTVARTCTPLSLQVEDTGFSTDNAQVFLGMLVQSFTIRFNTGDGAVEWEADLIGQGSVTPAANAVRTRAVATAALTTLDLDTGITLVANEPERALVGASASTNINGNTDAKLLDFEMVISREIELAYGAANTRRPNIRRESPPEITFTATLEFQATSDLTKYVNDPGENTGTPNVAASDETAMTFNDDDDAFWDGSFDTWHVRLANPVAVSGNGAPTTATTPVPTTAISGGNLDGDGLYDMFATSVRTNDCVLDIYLDKVSYAESPIVLDRNQQTVTIRMQGRALYDFTDSRLGVFRLFNGKTSSYATAANTA